MDHQNAVSRLWRGAMICLLSALLLPGCQTYRIVDPALPPPTRGELCTSWICVGPEAAYRLDLVSDGTARLYSFYWSNEARWEYQASDWTLDDDYLMVSFEPVRNAPDPVYLRAFVARDSMNVTISLDPTTGVPAGKFIRASLFDEHYQRVRDP